MFELLTSRTVTAWLACSHILLAVTSSFTDRAHVAPVFAAFGAAHYEALVNKRYTS